MNRCRKENQQPAGRFGLGSARPYWPCLQRKQRNTKQIHLDRFLAPTDFRYTLKLTQDAIRARGLPSPPDFKPGYRSVSEDGLKFPDALINLLQAARPILELGYERVIQSFRVFRDEIYPLSPCISLKIGQQVIGAVFSLQAHGSSAALSNLDVIDVEILKSVVAIALLVKGDIQTPLASDLEGQLMWNVDSCFDQEQIQIEDIILATLLVSCSTRHQTSDFY